MGKYENRNKQKELGIIALITVITGYFGLMGFPLLMLIYPSFAIAMGVKHGIDYNIGIMTASSLLLSIALGYVYTPILFAYIGLAYILNKGINKNKRISNIVTEGASYTFIVISIMMIALRFYFNLNIIEELKAILESNLIANLDGLEAMNLDYDLDSMRRSMEELIDTVLIAFPSILLMISIAISAVSYGVSSYVIRKNGITYIAPFRLADFRLSYNFSVAAVLMLLATIVMNMFKIGNHDVLTANLTFIIFALLFVQGLGVTSFMLVKNKVSKVIRIIIIIFLIVSSYASIIVSLVGAFDVMFNFRKLKDR